MAKPVELRVLGELDAAAGGEPLDVPRGNARRLLSMLIANRGHTVSDHTLVDWLWDDDPPPNATPSMRNVVRRLRKLIGDDTIERTPSGYRLAAKVSVDADRFDEFVARARRAFTMDDAAGAADAIDIALAMVRGPAFADVRDEAWAMPFAHTIDENVCLAEELWAAIRLRGGDAGADLGRLRAAAEAQPQRELRWQQLVEAATRSGRRAEALRAVHQARRALANFGVLPGPALLAAEQAALGADEVAPDEPPGARRLEATRANPMAGRTNVLERLVVPRRVSWLTGAAGHGKTRLLAEIAHRASQTGDLVAYAAVERGGSGLQLVADLARDLLSIGPPGRPMPADLALLLGRTGPSDDAPMLPSAELLRVRIRAALVDLLTTATSRGSVLVIVDNAQWLDGEATDTIVHLIDRSPAAVRFMIAARPLTDPDASLLFAQLTRAQSMFTCLVDPLGPEDLDELISLSAPVLDEERRARLARSVLASSAGDPLVANELIRHQLAAATDEGAAPALESIVAQTLTEIDERARAVMDAMVLIGRPSTTLVAAATGAGVDATASAVESLRAARILTESFDGTFAFRLEQFADVARARQRPATAAAMRRRLIDWLTSNHGDPFVIAEHLLALEQRTSAERRLLDQTVTAALRAPFAMVDHGAALALARAYLAAVRAGEPTAASVRAQLFVASALLANGDGEQARSLFQLATERARAFDDPALIADAILARGPILLGGAGSRRLAAEAEDVYSRLRADDVARRVQLGAWTAHHRFNRGDRAGAYAIINEVTPLASLSKAAALRGLVLAARAQGEQLAGGDLVRATGALDDLEGWVRLTGDEISEAACRLLSVGLTFLTGTIDEVRMMGERALEAALRLARPDVRWLSSAVTVAVAAAVGDLEAAHRAVDKSDREGRQLGVGGAAPVIAAQRTILSIMAGTLGSMTALLEPVGKAPSAPTEVLSIYGLACVQAGDVDAAHRVAALLGERDDLLSAAGLTWTLVAMAGAQLAWATANVALADRLWADLHHWSGTGLSLYGVAYVGAADLWLGLLAAVTGRTLIGLRLLDGAIEQERRRGAVAWERRAIELREEVARGGQPATLR